MLIKTGTTSEKITNNKRREHKGEISKEGVMSKGKRGEHQCIKEKDKGEERERSRVNRLTIERR